MPPGPVSTPGEGCGAVTLLAGTLAALGATALAASLLFPPLALLPVALGLLLVAGVLSMLLRSRGPRPPLERLPARVVALRADVTSRADAGAVRRLITVLETTKGARELATPEPLAASLAPGDLGVAYVEGDALVAFHAPASGPPTSE